MSRSLRMVALLLTLVFFAGSTPAVSQQLEQRSFIDGRVTMLVPTSFTPMSEEVLELKYPSQQRPTLVFSNPAGTVNVALNHTQNAASEADVPGLHRSMEQLLRRVHPTAEWHDSRTGQRDGMRFFVLDFVTPALDTDIRNIIFATPLDGRMLLVSFNCVVELQSSWAPVGQKIIDSITIAGG